MVGALQIRCHSVGDRHRITIHARHPPLLPSRLSTASEDQRPRAILVTGEAHLVRVLGGAATEAAVRMVIRIPMAVRRRRRAPTTWSSDAVDRYYTSNPQRLFLLQQRFAQAFTQTNNNIETPANDLRHSPLSQPRARGTSGRREIWNGEIAQAVVADM
ncbi:hypothetical protein E4U14_004695 [Claviceps sp. LM454 group G7]|nr:hypothetical protein E4U14_004695 [Claviceps sp. LM454 group G7]